MANLNLFRRLFGSVPAAVATNEAGGRAYTLSSEQALAQFAATGCLNGTFYASDEQQLQATLSLANQCEPRFVAATAVFAREQGCMKDMPALLCAVLAARDGALLQAVFARVIDSAKMLRTFVQILRSGVTGRKSLGTLPRRLVREWLAARSDQQLFDGSIGNQPSLADIVKMVHPKPASPARSNLLAYLLGKPFDLELLPPTVAQFEQWKLGAAEMPDVSFQFLASQDLTPDQWRTIAQRASWTTLRMNLNTLLRHRVFECAATSAIVAARLADAAAIRRAKAFPYQIMTTLQNIRDEVPGAIRTALEQALESALANVPELPGRTIVAVDVSGSMQSPATSQRRGSTSVTTCLDVAALFAAALLRKNPGTLVIPFHDKVCDVALDATASVAATHAVLCGLPSGGTNCSAVLAHCNRKRLRADRVVYVSDNQSWVDTTAHGQGTAMMSEWRRFQAGNRQAKLVCIDVQPYQTVQAPPAADVIHVGGFSDHVFEVLRSVASGDTTPDHFVDCVRKVAV